MRLHRHLALLGSLAALSGCTGEIESGLSADRFAEGLTGCKGKASSTVPPSGQYFLTTFGNGSSDDGIMSCGTYTKHGSWYYAASRQRYGCGAALRIQANGRCVIARADDYGPDVCVEKAAGGAIIDVSPLVAQKLFGVSSAGWSDHLVVTVTRVASSSQLGPCTDGGGPANPPPDPRPADACQSTTLARQVPSATCVQSASDGNWYRCVSGEWLSGASGCATSYPWCHSATLGRTVPPRTCVQARSDGRWYQCASSGWASPVKDGAGPLGTCAVEYAL
ncbi:MAG: hypothetical protein EXR72_03845 [Myxococcales bacterium]|nr:hypothetical protein [Myxococcales bacterium]